MASPDSAMPAGRTTAGPAETQDEYQWVHGDGGGDNTLLEAPAVTGDAPFASAPRLVNQSADIQRAAAKKLLVQPGQAVVLHADGGMFLAMDVHKRGDSITVDLLPCAAGTHTEADVQLADLHPPTWLGFVPSLKGAIACLKRMPWASDGELRPARVVVEGFEDVAEGRETTISFRLARCASQQLR